MDLKISMGNSKLGKIPNLNLPPGVTCVNGVPCYTDGCYALKAWKMYPNVRKAWESNLNLYRTEPHRYFDDLYEYLKKVKPELFRIHSAGDMPDEEYWFMLAGVLEVCEDTQFLMFTKRYDYNWLIKPENLSLFLSTWPGLPVPASHIPKAWLEEDDRKPKEYLRCGGGCQDCGFACWKLRDCDVVFKKH